VVIVDTPYAGAFLVLSLEFRLGVVCSLPPSLSTHTCTDHCVQQPQLATTNSAAVRLAVGNAAVVGISGPARVGIRGRGRAETRPRAVAKALERSTGRRRRTVAVKVPKVLRRERVSESQSCE
jgi:hypothetical protein